MIITPHTRLRRAALVTTAAAALVALVALSTVRSDAAAQAQRTLTLVELDKGSTFKHVRNTKGASRRSNLPGDLLVFRSPLAVSGERVGALNVTCTTTKGARDFRRSAMSCAGVYALRDGTLTAQALVDLSKPATVGAITGGTGAYANARGTFRSSDTQDGSETVITLVE